MGEIGGSETRDWWRHESGDRRWKDRERKGFSLEKINAWLPGGCCYLVRGDFNGPAARMERGGRRWGVGSERTTTN